MVISLIGAFIFGGMLLGFIWGVFEIFLKIFIFFFQLLKKTVLFSPKHLRLHLSNKNEPSITGTYENELKDFKKDTSERKAKLILSIALLVVFSTLFYFLSIYIDL